MLTTEGGPVVIAAKTLCALTAIRRQALLPALYERVCMAKSVRAAAGELGGTQPWESGPGPAGWEWLIVGPDMPEVVLPERVAGAAPEDAATLRLALGLHASRVLIDGPIKERAKLSFIKCQGTLSVLVDAYRLGKLSAVEPMVKALKSLGHGDVLPPPEALESMWRALAQLKEQ
jgi:predicted nucleic acid-binding protein